MSIRLKTPEPYVAISYAWGDPGDTETIEVDGHRVQVSVSLHGALQALRKNNCSVLVWVDALSIDQQNKEERAQQVKLMKNIYSKATSVAIWLGPDEDESTQAVNFITELVRRPQEASLQNENASILPLGTTPQHLINVAALFERPYWRRLWVVQEVFNAKEIKVHCGHSETSWEVYREASSLFSQHRKEIADVMDRGGGRSSHFFSPDQLSHDQALIYQGPASLLDSGSFVNKGPEALLEALCTCRRKISSDPRDKLYGLLGILDQEISNEFTPDYNSTVKEVYSDLVDYLLTTTKRLDVICESIHFPPATNSANLPSFVPDWSHISPMTSLRQRYDFKASGSTEAIFKFQGTRHNRLEISAISIDTIGVRGMAVGTMCNVGDYLMAFLHWRALLLQNFEGQPADVQESVQEDFAATLSLGQVPATHRDNSKWLRACYNVFSNLIKTRLPGILLEPSLKKYENKRDVKSAERRKFLQRNFGDMMMGRCFFITKEDHLGMGTGFLLPGDEVVVPLGCSTPIVLRQQGARKEYQYVGDAYVHGYMDGKAIDEWKSHTRKVTKYVLR